MMKRSIYSTDLGIDLASGRESDFFKWFLACLRSNLAAVEDRGLALSFEPSVLEVHGQTAAWFWDQEIYDWVAGHFAPC